MSNPNYTLEIISHHPKFNNQSMKKYYVDGIETVGAWGDEPFEVRFTNKTWQKVQVKISLDGTDILSGKPADTQVSKDMWVVNAYGTLSLKAWPETNNGGAAFVFTSANNSVAVHTHGDLSSRGIIAAAVFTEGHVEPTPIVVNPWPWRTEEHHHHHHHYERSKGYDHYYGPVWTTTIGGNTAGGTFTGGVILNNSTSGNLGSVSNSVYTCNNAGPVAAGGSFNLCDGAAASEVSESSFDSLVSVGAGEHVDQKITYVTGLIKPTFTETVRVKYMWWDDLQDKLRTNTKAQPQPSGFPGDHDRKNIDLGCTPRIGEKRGSFRRVEQQQAFTRF